jgi:CheY-like chemotaxis protein
MGVAMLLLVDDEIDLREMLTQYLTLHGHTVQEAANGREALQLVKQKSPRLILLDLNMPVLSGWEFLSERRDCTQLSEIPVVVISGSMEVESRALKAGATVVVSKPFEPSKLRRIIENLLRAPHIRRDKQSRSDI